jgi:uncharacterized membrane protein YjfL (UPF0719 family)
MPDTFDPVALAVSASYVLLAIVALLVAKLVKDFATPYRVDQQLTKADNPALGLAMTGYFLGVFLVFLGACIGDSPLDEGENFSASLMLGQMGSDFLWVLLGIVLLNVGRLVVDRLLLHSFSTVKEIVQDRNVGTGAVEFAAYVATGLIAAGSLHGEGGGVLSALGFFALGQLALVVFGLFYQWTTRYDVHAAIEDDNVAAGVAMGGNIVAIGIVLLRATVGDLSDWQADLFGFAYALVAGLVLLGLLRRLTDFVLLPGTTLRHEIAVDRNLAAAFLEGGVAIGTASVVFFMV